jgi:7-cyano-7-deazaguanine synthase
MTMSNKLVLAFSGGCDSSVLLFMAADRGYDEIHTITFDYGQRHKREIECIPLQQQNLKAKYPNVIFTNKILDVSYLKDISPTSSLTNTDIDNPDISKIAGDAQPVSYVPFRNQMFLTICCSYAESIKATSVWYGAAQIDSAAGYWDTTDSFVDNFNNLIVLNRTTKINIAAPLLTMSKQDIVKEGVRLGVRFQDTWTCYSSREDRLADATTPSSSLRLRGFIDSGYRDPIKYIQQDKIDQLYIQNNCIEL